MTLRIVVLPPFDREFFGGADRLSIDAASIYDLIDQLDALAPGFADQAPARAVTIIAPACARARALRAGPAALWTAAQVWTGGAVDGGSGAGQAAQVLGRARCRAYSA